MMHRNKFRVSVHKCVYYLIIWFDIYNLVCHNIIKLNLNYGLEEKLFTKLNLFTLEKQKCTTWVKMNITVQILFYILHIFHCHCRYIVTFSSSLPA